MINKCFASSQLRKFHAPVWQLHNLFRQVDLIKSFKDSWLRGISTKIVIEIVLRLQPDDLYTLPGHQQAKYQTSGPTPTPQLVVEC